MWKLHVAVFGAGCRMNGGRFIEYAPHGYSFTGSAFAKSSVLLSLPKLVL